VQNAVPLGSLVRHAEQVLDSDAVDAARRVVRSEGAGGLVIDDLRHEDVARIGWSGSKSHVRAVAEALARVPAGDVEYLAVRAPTGDPVAKGGVNYTAHADAGAIWQLATHPELQSLGLGTRLVREAERRIRRRGLRWAILGVEDNNPRARALYERLGYEAYGREATSWEQEDELGNATMYETEVALLRKHL
jgi:ribosomal protein S18 acetylase RimI-like enzyme